MKLSGKYILQVIRDKKPLKTINLTNTITVGFIEYLSQLFSGNNTVSPKYVGFGIGTGIGEENKFYSKLDNEVLRVPITTYNNTGTGILTTETIVDSITLQNAGITNIKEIGAFCVNDIDDETTTNSTINTGTLISRVVVDINIESGDEFLIKRIDTLTGG